MTQMDLTGTKKPPNLSPPTESGLTEDAPPPGESREFKPLLSVQIKTARYSNKNIVGSGLVPVRITRGYPRFKLAYKPCAIMELAPQGHMLKMEEQSFHLAFGEQLAFLSPRKIADGILSAMTCPAPGTDEPAKGVVLLCFEDLRKPGLYCHRTQVARWLEATFGVTVSELPE